jgi:hypothetical protein
MIQLGDVGGGLVGPFFAFSKVFGAASLFIDLAVALLRRAIELLSGDLTAFSPVSTRPEGVLCSVTCRHLLRLGCD